MKILIVSDSHGDTAAMRTAVARENPDKVFFLGDMDRDIRRLAGSIPELPIVVVMGKYDAQEGPEQLLVTAGGVKFFLTHGHEYKVKLGTRIVFQEGIGMGADVVCFGHTHQAVCKKQDGVWLVNPGTIGGVGATATYAVAEAEQGSVSVELKAL